MRKTEEYLCQLLQFYQQEKRPRQKTGFFYLSPEKRIEILREILANYTESKSHG